MIQKRTFRLLRARLCFTYTNIIASLIAAIMLVVLRYDTITASNFKGKWYMFALIEFIITCLLEMLAVYIHRNYKIFYGEFEINQNSLQWDVGLMTLRIFWPILMSVVVLIQEVKEDGVLMLLCLLVMATELITITFTVCFIKQIIKYAWQQGKEELG